MPQLDFSTFLPQLVWLAITFTALYILMARSALPRVAEVLEERQRRLDSDLERAQDYKTESEKLEADYEKLTAQARAGVQAHLKAEREKLAAVLNEKQAEMTAKMDARLAEAEAGIATAKSQTLDDLEAIAAEACISIVAKLSGRKLTPGAVKKTVRANISSSARGE